MSSPSDPTEPLTAEEIQAAGAHSVSLDRFKVLGRIGAGGMGEIYLAEDTQLDRKVALKILPARFIQNADRVRRFVREAKAASALNQPNIITIYEIGESYGTHYIVTEYIQGQTLRQRMADRLTIEMALDVAIQVASALKAAHAAKIVHRDIKPENIMIRPDGLVKVLDFGIAKLIERSSSSVPDDLDRPITDPLNDLYATSRMPDVATPANALDDTDPGIIIGTVTYMSPEQLRGQKVDVRADIFSLGVVLYEVITGRSPFARNTQVEVIAAILEREPVPLIAYRPEVSRELERIVSKALRKDRDARYQLVEDLLTDLKDFNQELKFQAKLGRSSQPDAGSITPLDVAEPGQPLAKQQQDPYATTTEFDKDRLEALDTSDISTPHSVQRTDREPERRQLTVLVCGCGLFESETYLGLDTEDQVRVLGAFERACEEPVRRFGGTVVQCNEKELLACFGFPVAYENSARRAARSGQAILDVMESLGEQFRREDKLEFNPWVGIHTGPAIVGLKAGVVSLVGEARNVAVRLEEVAVAGQMICTEATYRVFKGRFQCASLGPQKVRGITQPLEMFRVERNAVTGSLLDAVAPAELSPLTGRDREIGLLKDRWEQAQEGMGQVVLLIGEPGLGKSRLVHTLKEHVLGQMVEGKVDATVIEWRCSPHFQNTRLYPAIDFYERALGFNREEPPEDRFDRLLHRLGAYDLVRPETIPLWASLLSLPTPDRFPPLSLSPVREREETFRVMLEWLHASAARKPILFIVEDLHWVDASTLEFLGQFLAEGLHESILTVLTFRPEFKTPWPAVAHQTSLALNRLTRRQVGELMRKKMENALPETLVDQIYERAGGVPLFVEEFTKMVQESGVPDSEWASSASGTMLLGREIPATLQDLMMTRLDRMEGERELAQLAATLGREFSHELLSAVADMDEPTLESELAKLVQAEILYPKGRPPRRSYIFKHALLEDALYNALVKSKRQQFHRRIAEVLEAQFQQTVETRPELLAHHFTEAGIGDRAIGYWLKAGLRLLERWANVEAIGHLTKGLALVRAFAESPERDAQELQFLNGLGTAYMATYGYAAPENGPVFLRARELADRIGQPAQRFAVMWGNWAWNVNGGKYRLSMELASEAVQFVETLNDPGMMMEALFLPGMTMVYRGDFVGARDQCERAVADYDDRERTKFWAAYTGQDAGATHRFYLAVALWHLGYPDQALNVNRMARDLARTIGQPYIRAYDGHHTAWLYQHCRLGAEALTAAEEESTIAGEQGFAWFRASSLLHQAAGMVLLDRPKEALPLLHKGLDLYRATGSEMAVPYHLSVLGEAYAMSGRFEDARRTMCEALAIAEKNDDRFQEAELHRLLGELHLAETDDQAAAAVCFHTAIETARRQQSRAWELRATMSLARLWHRQGRRDEARDMLAAVYATYTEGFTTPDLIDAKALLELLS